MKKEQADKIITEYLQKIYGFAMKKAYSYDEAEDVCSEILCSATFFPNKKILRNVNSALRSIFI
jgi:hypothetical protein